LSPESEGEEREERDEENEASTSLVWASLGVEVLKGSV
jgi:hypothetical protein